MSISQNTFESLLLSSKVLSQKALKELLELSENSRVSLEEALVDKEILTERQLNLMLAKYLKVPFVELSKVNIPDDVFRMVPERIARKYKVIPFAQDKKEVKIAMADPSNKELVDMISTKISQKISIYYASESDISNALQMYRKDIQKTLDGLLRGASISETLTNDVPIAKIVDLLITYAYRDKASDIHLEPEEDDLVIRFRIDSVLRDVLVLDKNLHDRIVTRIKVLARLRTDEHLSAQDGKMRMEIDDETIDIRVSIIPLTEGEKVVLRLLSSKFRNFSLSNLGMNKKDLKKVIQAVGKSHGMVLSTGPTGSGKTTSIYSILKILNTREKNITTIEDPVEYRIKGVNQIQVNTKTNLTFASGLRSILRQDPNIIFVGEIRDSETASIAINAALTGHLVLSTLHTSDAATALPRLIDMKVEPFLVSSTVSVIIAQRLVRKICAECKIPVRISKKELIKSINDKKLLKYFKKGKIYKGKGCSHCQYTGYDGRIGIFEVLEITDKIKYLITEKQDSSAIQREAINEGMTTMLEDGLMKVAAGETTLEEIIRVIKIEKI